MLRQFSVLKRQCLCFKIADGGGETDHRTEPAFQAKRILQCPSRLLHPAAMLKPRQQEKNYILTDGIYRANL